MHQAIKADRQVQYDFKYAKYSSKTFGSYNQAPMTTTPLPQPNLLQATTTSQVTRKLRQLQVVLLLQATSSQELHHLQLNRMRPSRQVPSNA